MTLKKIVNFLRIVTNFIKEKRINEVYETIVAKSNFKT